MKKLLIIKTGTTFPSIAEKHGDFDEFIIRQLDIPPEEVIVSTVYEGAALPELKDISAIIITGSHSMVTDGDGWCTMLSEWLKSVVGKAIPTLGICYGHQLLAHVFGGEVGYSSKGIEIGTAGIGLTAAGRSDSLLGILPGNFLGHVTHYQTVKSLPPGAVLLAGNSFEKHHAFVIHDNIWGVQFHPEFNADILHAYIDKQLESLQKGGYDLEAVRASVRENPYGKQLLKRFIQLV